MTFDLNKIQQTLRDEGVDEESWAKDLVHMNNAESVRSRMYAHRMIGEIFMSSKLNQQKKQVGILDEFGMDQLNLTVQERRRLGVIQEAEVVDGD